MKKFYKALLLSGCCILSSGVSKARELSNELGGRMQISDIEKPATRLNYLNNTYCFQDHGVLTSVVSDTQLGMYMTFDQTIFYPQGGGQPSDVGHVTFQDGLKVEVGFVGLQNGQVLHFIKNIDSSDTESMTNELLARIGSRATLDIIPERRMINAKAHTSGHLIGSIVETVESSLIAFKGHHFPEGCYLEFEGQTTSDLSVLTTLVNQKIQEALAAQLSIQATLASPESLNVLRLPKNYQIPTGKPCRIVQINGFPPVPCGGTHLATLKDLQSLVVDKIKTKKGIVRLSYRFK